MAPQPVLERERGEEGLFVGEVVEVVPWLDHEGKDYKPSVPLGPRPAPGGPAGFYDLRVRDLVEETEWLSLTPERLEVARAIDWANGPSFGAIASFVGVVRDHGEGRSGVTSIDYQAYEKQVVPSFARLVAEARARWGELGRIAVWHRVGTVLLGEASVVVVVSAPHRAEAFEACHHLVDTLKATAPIWKKEHWPGGSAWSPHSYELAR